MPARNYEKLTVHPGCLMCFIDETGHEEFADANYPVFGLGGCAVMAGAIEEVIKKPWRAMKDAHFGGAATLLHAADLRAPKPAQFEVLNEFFAKQPFGRFAVTLTAAAALPGGLKPYSAMPDPVRKRIQELVSRCARPPVEIALLHEESQRGDALVQHYFGETVAEIDGKRIPVHHGFLPKRIGDEAMEVADFIVQAAGGQALRRSRGNDEIRKDFRAVFHANPAWSSFFGIEGVTLSPSSAA